MVYRLDNFCECYRLGNQKVGVEEEIQNSPWDTRSEGEIRLGVSWHNGMSKPENRSE